MTTSPLTSTLVFARVPRTALDAAAAHGLDASARLWPRLEAVPPGPDAAVVAVDASVIAAAVEPGPVPPAALLNLSPYRPPTPVTAGGGVVVRRGDDGPEVLMILRRGVWDLPKGKQDEGETERACALREVREEVGIDALAVDKPLGATVHGYVDGDVYAVKTTWWYLMTTSATTFSPQAEEEIEDVAWVPWAEARDRVGYASLQRHLDAVEPVVRSWSIRGEPPRRTG